MHYWFDSHCMTEASLGSIECSDPIISNGKYLGLYVQCSVNTNDYTNYLWILIIS